MNYGMKFVISLPQRPGFFSGKFPKLTQCQPSFLILPNGLQNSLPCYIFKRTNSSTWSTVTSISSPPEPCPPASYCSIIVKPICHLGICVPRVLGMHGRRSPWPLCWLRLVSASYFLRLTFCFSPGGPLGGPLGWPQSIVMTFPLSWGSWGV